MYNFTIDKPLHSSCDFIKPFGVFFCDLQYTVRAGGRSENPGRG